MIGVCSRLHLYERTKFKNTVSTEKCPLFWQLSSCNVVCHGHVPVWEAKFQVKPSNHCIKPRSQSSQQHHEINEIIASNRSNAGPACQKGGRKWHVAATQCRSKNETCKQLSNISKTQLRHSKKLSLNSWLMGASKGSQATMMMAPHHRLSFHARLTESDKAAHSLALSSAYLV